MRLKNLFSGSKLPPFDSEKLKIRNPKLWKKLKKQFDTGRKIAKIQYYNGLKRSNEKALRTYLFEYVDRFIKYAGNAFPTSFNVLEPFFIFNQYNSIIQLIEEEESYGISLLDFLDFVTNPSFNLGDIDLYENIPEKKIYHFSFTDFDEYNFSNDNGNIFLIGSLSVVRQGNEVSILIQAGESYDKKEAEEYFKTHTRKSIVDSMHPRKKSLGLEVDDEEPKVIYFEGLENFWLHSVAILFDIEKKSIDIRHVAKDQNISYQILTDDFNAIFLKENSIPKEEIKDYIKNHLKKLSNYDAVFDFAKYCLALPYYVLQKEEKLVSVTYETSLDSIIKGPVSKRHYSSVPNKYKVYAKPFYYLESNTQTIFESKELNDNNFNIEKTGFWKRIGISEDGFDKKGRKIIGKTWVERNDIYYSSPKGITTVTKVEIFNDKNAGHIYIMRQPGLEVNIFKVGLTRRNVDKRRKELSNTSTPDKFLIVDKYYTKDCVEAEKKIHEKLKIYRLSTRREFFRCDSEIIIKVCRKIIAEINK